MVKLILKCLLRDTLVQEPLRLGSIVILSFKYDKGQVNNDIDSVKKDFTKFFV